MHVPEQHKMQHSVKKHWSVSLLFGAAGRAEVCIYLEEFLNIIRILINHFHDNTFHTKLTVLLEILCLHKSVNKHQYILQYDQMQLHVLQ